MDILLLMHCKKYSNYVVYIGSGEGQYVKVPIWITVEVLSSIFFYSVTMQY